MPRARDSAPQHVLWRCVEPFAIFPNGVPTVYGEGQEVLDSDPILTTHRAQFEPASARIARRAPVEQTTAVPGEVRPASMTTTSEVPHV